MTPFIRIALYIFAGWLSRGGVIDDEIRSLITTDETLVASIEAGLSLLIGGVTYVWWRIAKRLGLPT